MRHNMPVFVQEFYRYLFPQFGDEFSSRFHLYPLSLHRIWIVDIEPAVLFSAPRMGNLIKAMHITNFIQFFWGRQVDVC